MAQKAKATSTTSDDPWWFLNPEIGRLAKPELVFVTQWTWHEKAAKEFLWDGAGGGRIRWYAEIEIFENNPVFKTCAGLLTFNTAVNQGLWHHNYFTMDWEASRGIYAGPAILLVQNPECPEQSSVFYDGRASVRIVARLMRFHHGDAMRELCRRGLMPAAKSPPPAEQPAPEAGPPQKSSSGSAPASKPVSGSQALDKLTVKGWVADAVKDHPRPRGEKDYAGYLLNYAPQKWSKHSIQNALSELASGKTQSVKRDR
jgi:hypothetical protein